MSREKNESETCVEAEALKKLADAVMAEHSFEYQTLAEAKKLVCVDGLEYCFDALSLCGYHSNLSEDKLAEFKRMLWLYYEKNYDKEQKKQRKERDSLFRYLMTENCPYRNYKIEKHTHPDFILTGEQKIGVEVTELTTQKDQVLLRILERNCGQGKSAEEIKAAAIKKHGEKAEEYFYKEVFGSACVGVGLDDLNCKKRELAGKLLHKAREYEKDKHLFDQFIVLGDAQSSFEIAITEEYDVEAIFELLKEKPEAKNTAFIILWEASIDGSRRVSRCDL